ncbi:Vps16, C-terminal region-domain-containing protein [Catenaria anguillulae PL171]|uniref:Probable vacuolar protein sorting-associated protein 16 homolog n=1 Tax=Catenaria anguillulae PL171 TaxID=765915 RepID=A0A1Y2H9H1_9FUNG|nr:Vps16, C-terminal region-domain-containing protein [Catenaria anguillulae PL171]
MSSAAITRAGWIPLGDSAIVHRPIYALGGGRDSSPSHATWQHARLEHLHVAISPSGSFIASCRNDHKPFFATNASSMAIPLAIHRANGQLVRSIPWERELASILTLGWTDTEALVAVLDDGTVRIYPLYGEPTFASLGDEARNGIASCAIWPTGMAALTTTGFFVVIRSWKAPIPRMYSHYQVPNTPPAWTFVPEHLTDSGSIELLVPLAKSLIRVSEMDADERPFGSVLHLKSSPSSNFMASLSSHLALEICLAASLKVTSSIDLTGIVGGDGSTAQLAWCGDDAVLAAFDDFVVLLHISGEHHVVDLLDPVKLSESFDSTFCLSPHDFSLFSVVPYPVLTAFKYGSTHPVALLLDAFDHYGKRSPQAVDLLESLLRSNQLDVALNACLEAAAHAWDVKEQRSLLSAVQFGRAWLHVATSSAETHRTEPVAPLFSLAQGQVSPDTGVRDTLVLSSNRLRVLNTARQLGYPVSQATIAGMGGDPALIRLFTHARDHQLAVRAAELLGLDHVKTQAVLDWARLRLTTSPVDGNVPGAVDVVIQRVFSQVPPGSPALDFSDLAISASRVGRPDVAAHVLKYESNISRQVPLLLELQQPVLALSRAVESHDRDLVYLVLIYLRKTLMLPAFVRAVRDVPGAYAFLEQYARSNDRKLLHDCYSLEDQNLELGNLLLEDAAMANSVENKMALLRDAAHAFSRSKTAANEQRVTEQHIQLLHYQAQLAQKYPPTNNRGPAWESLSIGETLVQLARTGRVSDAKDAKNKLGVSDKQFAWCMVSGLAKARDWAELERFAFTRRPAIGYLPVVRACLEMGANDEAKKYIAKCDVRARVDLFIKAGAIKEASDVAFQLNDMPVLVHLRQVCHDDDVRRDIDGKIAQLRRA